MIEPTNGRDPHISLRVMLLVILAFSQIVMTWRMWELSVSMSASTDQLRTTAQKRHEQYLVLEAQHRKSSEAFAELVWMLSRPQEQRPHLEIPSSLWDRLNEADREAIGREIRRDPMRSERGSPRRRPTDG